METGEAVRLLRYLSSHHCPGDDRGADQYALKEHYPRYASIWAVISVRADYRAERQRPSTPFKTKMLSNDSEMWGILSSVVNLYDSWLSVS